MSTLAAMPPPIWERSSLLRPAPRFCCFFGLFRSIGQIPSSARRGRLFYLSHCSDSRNRGCAVWRDHDQPRPRHYFQPLQEDRTGTLAVTKVDRRPRSGHSAVFGPIPTAYCCTILLSSSHLNQPLEVTRAAPCAGRGRINRDVSHVARADQRGCPRHPACTS